MAAVKKFAWPALIAAGAAVVCYVLTLQPPNPAANGKSDLRAAEAKHASARRAEADVLYSLGRFDEAAERYAALIAELGKSQDKDTQDEVGTARLRLGYVASKQNDFKEAGRWFREAARTYKGTERTSPDFGGIADQGAYQAAVCLAAEGKKDQAEKAFVAFLKERSFSPLVHAAYRRLVRLNGGEPKTSYDRLLQSAIAKQEKHIRFELSTCGPKAIAHLLKVFGKPVKSYQELAKLCGTTGRGTTFEGMQKGLKACGLESRGFLVNRQDFGRLALPAIWLSGDHYVVLLRVTDKAATVFDPLYNSERTLSIPPKDEGSFAATILTLEFPKEKKHS